MDTSSLKNKTKQVFAFGKEKFSKYLPINVKPKFYTDYVLNGEHNSTFQIYQDAYDDSPTNASIINAFVSYIFAEGLVDKGGLNLDKYIKQEDVQMAILDLKKFGGFSLQVIWNSDSEDKKPLRLEYMPIYKLGINYDRETLEVDAYWYSYDWTNRAMYRPEKYPKFTGRYTEGQDLEVLYVRRPTSEPFFPIPDYLAGIRWAQMEGQISNAGFNHFKNSVGELTVINYNDGEVEDSQLAKKEADRVRGEICGTSNNASVVVSFNDGIENALTIDRVASPDLAQHNVFYSEEAERKLIVAHSAPPILFAGSNQGSGFSNNANEREIALKDAYRRNINPFRLVFLNGVYDVFKLIDEAITLDFKDFDSEEKLDTNEPTIN